MQQTRYSGPSWLTFLGHMKDSLWGMDLFRCESAMLRTHWVLVVMDQYTRRIIGFGVHAGTIDGAAFVGCSTAPFEGDAGCRTSSVPITIRFIGSTSGKPTWDTGSDRNQVRPLRSTVLCVSRLRSFHCHQVRSKRERHLPFAARFAGNIGLRSNSPDTPRTVPKRGTAYRLRGAGLL
jgi:hypothetical protein